MTTFSTSGRAALALNSERGLRCGTMNDIAAIPTAEQINLEHRLAHSKANEAVQHATNCGLMLLQVKASKAHGEWLPWLNGEIEAGRLEVGTRQVQRYIKLASNTTRESFLIEAPSIRAALELLSDKDEVKQGELISAEIEAERQARESAEKHAQDTERELVKLYNKISKLEAELSKAKPPTLTGDFIPARKKESKEREGEAKLTGEEKARYLYEADRATFTAWLKDMYHSSIIADTASNDISRFKGEWDWFNEKTGIKYGDLKTRLINLQGAIPDLLRLIEEMRHV